MLSVIINICLLDASYSLLNSLYDLTSFTWGSLFKTVLDMASVFLTLNIKEVIALENQPKAGLSKRNKRITKRSKQLNA